MYLIPENLTRLRFTAFAHEAEMVSSVGENCIRSVAKKLAETALSHILNKCITRSADYLNFPGNKLELDVYVLSPDELNKLVCDARQSGMRDHAFHSSIRHSFDVENIDRKES